MKAGCLLALAAGLPVVALGAPTITFNASRVEYSGAPVLTTITGVVDPNQNDVLACYTNETIPYTARSFVKFIYLDNTTVEPSYTTTGTASFVFQFINYHENWVCRFFKASPTATGPWYNVRTGAYLPGWTLNGTSEVLPMKNLNEPVGIHLIQATKKGSVMYAPAFRAVWTTRDASGIQLKYRKRKMKGDDEEERKLYDHHHREVVIKATTYTYGPGDMCNNSVFLAATLGFKDPYQINTAVMHKLMYDQWYEYQVSDESTGTYSEWLSFRTAPKPRSNKLCKIAIFGDMGTAEQDGSFDGGQAPGRDNPGSLGTTRLINQKYDQNSLDMVVHFGDITYADGFTAKWFNYYEQVRHFAQHVPIMHTAGNHERDGMGSSPIRPISDVSLAGRQSEYGGECGVPYQFLQPQPYPSQNPFDDQEWYSFEYGPVHFLVLSAEQPFEPYTAQWIFAKQDLATVDRQVTPWLIVLDHRPLYTADKDGTVKGTHTNPPTVYTPANGSEFDPSSNQGTAVLLRESFEYLFNIYKVDMVLSGHVHNYERSCQVSKYEGPCLADSDAPPNRNPTAAFPKNYERFPNTPATGRYAPMYTVAGMAGRALDTGNSYSPLPYFTEFVNDTLWGMTYMEVDRTHLDFFFYDQATGNLVDHYQLEQYIAPEKEGEESYNPYGTDSYNGYEDEKYYHGSNEKPYHPKSTHTKKPSYPKPSKHTRAQPSGKKNNLRHKHKQQKPDNSHPSQ